MSSANNLPRKAQFKGIMRMAYRRNRLHKKSGEQKIGQKNDTFFSPFNWWPQYLEFLPQLPNLLSR